MRQSGLSLQISSTVIGLSYSHNGFAAGSTANASGALGKADGRTTEKVNSHITGNLVSIHSGGPLTLNGTVISATASKATSTARSSSRARRTPPPSTASRRASVAR